MLKIFTKKFYTKKKIIWISIILLVVLFFGWLIFGRAKVNNSIQIGNVTKQNLEETVLTTGQVVSSTDLNLSFQGSGVVRKVLVKEGDKVYQGQTLAYLDQGSALASLTTAQGSYDQAKATYEKLLNGATSEDLQVYENAVSGARVNLDNAYSGALNTLNGAYTSIYNAYLVAKNIQETYFIVSDQESIKVVNNKDNISAKLNDAKNAIIQIGSMANTDGAISSTANALSSVYNSLLAIRNSCDQDVYYSKVSSTDKTSLDTQKSSVATSTTSVNALQNSIASYKVALKTAEDNLNLKKIRPRQEDIDMAKAQMLSAQGQVDAASVLVNNSVIRAPESGTITQVDIKVGEQATAMKEVIVLQDVGNLHAEADVSEANIASLAIDQTIDYTFDALGSDQHFAGKVLTINPSSTVISGVVNYKVKGNFDNVPNLRPGMTANMTILVAKKDNVLAVPSTAVVNKKNKQFVRVIDDAKTKKYHEVEVKTGLQADGGLVEIISGLQEGQQIITYMKS